jgi:hypothetical protein
MQPKKRRKRASVATQARSEQRKAADADAEDAHRRLTDYMLSVIENPKAGARRRDQMASRLSKILVKAAIAARRSAEAERKTPRAAQPNVSDAHLWDLLVKKSPA